jgi:cyclic di-GMP phosphodiesterase
VLRKIAIFDLTVDMYISEIIETSNGVMPKKRKGMIRDERIISKFIEIGIEQVVIDTDKGLDVIELNSANDEYQNAVSEILDKAVEDFQKDLSTNYHSLELEWGSAKEIFKTSAKIIGQTILSIQKGEAINTTYFNEASKAISRSIMRNKDALTWLGKIRDQNSYLYEHSVNTATLMGIFAHTKGLSITEIEASIMGALLHDLGEAQINNEFFCRCGPLSEEEYEQVKKHVDIGLSLVTEESDIPDITRLIIAQHHERHDGSGYPKGLKGDEISLHGRMFAIVDTYDAITNNRCYKDAIPSSFGMRTLLELSKSHFDESLVHQFIKCMGIYPTGSLARLNNNQLAVVIAQNQVSPLKPMVKTIFSVSNNSYIEPRMLDLGKPECELKILKYENPVDYDINIDNFMPEEMH